MNRHTPRGRLLFACVLLGFALPTLHAGARPLGVNGQIAFDNPGGAGTVYTVNQDGHHVFRLTSSSSCCPSWSPDGTRLLVSGNSSDGRITTAIVNADGTGFHALPLPTPGLNLGCVVWSPDGSSCAADGWDDEKPSLNGVYRVNLNDGSAVRLTTNPLGGHDIPGDYSADGSQIVFGRYDASENGVGLFVVNADGGGLHELVAAIVQPANDGDWSPQGDEIVFSRHVTAGVPGSIWVVNSDRTGLHEIDVAGLGCGGSIGCHEPRWSPDGKKIVFATSQGTGGSVYTMNADGTALRRVAAIGDDPTWGTHPDVACTPPEKIQRQHALATFERTLKARQRAFFRSHRSATARRAFGRRQRAELKKLEASLAACG